LASSDQFPIYEKQETPKQHIYDDACPPNPNNSTLKPRDEQDPQQKTKLPTVYLFRQKTHRMKNAPQPQSQPEKKKQKKTTKKNSPAIPNIIYHQNKKNSPHCALKQKPHTRYSDTD